MELSDQVRHVLQYHFWPGPMEMNMATPEKYASEGEAEPLGYYRSMMEETIPIMRKGYMEKLRSTRSELHFERRLKVEKDPVVQAGISSANPRANPQVYCKICLCFGSKSEGWEGAEYSHNKIQSYALLRNQV
jgi:hypothetical protein